MRPNGPECSSTMSKQFEIEVAQELETILAHFKYDAAKVLGALRTSWSESTSGAQWKFTNFVAMMSKRLTSKREVSSVDLSTSLLVAGAVAAGMASPTSVGLSFKEGSQ